MSLVKDRNLRLWLKDEARTATMPILQYRTAKFSRLGPLGGSAEITLPARGAVAQELLTNPAFDALRTVDLFYRNLATPLETWVAVKYAGSRDASGDWLTVSLEPVLGHLLRRRVVQTSSKARTTTTAKADNAFLQVIRQQLKTGTLIEPTGYPSGVRDDWGGTWTVDVHANRTLHPTTIVWTEEPGKNLHDVVAYGADTYDLWLFVTETSAGAWEIDVDYPVQDTDLSADGNVVFSFLRNTIRNCSVVYDYTGLANVWSIRGDGTGGTQTVIFAQDATSVSHYGTYENQGTIAKGSATDVSNIATAELSRTAEPRVTFQMGIREGPETRFNYDFGLRDLVRFYDPVIPLDAGVKVIGYTIDSSPSGTQVDIVCSDPPRTLAHELLWSSSLDGGRAAGGRFKAVGSP